MSSCLMAQNSPGLRSPKNPTIIKVEKIIQESLRLMSVDDVAKILASHSITASKASGMGGLKLDG